MSQTSEKPDDVLVVEDDATGQYLFATVIRRLGAVAHVASNVAEAEKLVGERKFAVALIDKNLGSENGLTFMRWLQERQPACASVIVTAYGNLDSAIEALRMGAADYILKPFELDVLSHRLKLLLERNRLVLERERMRAQLMQSDRMASLGVLAAGVVHELNTPLACILSSLQYLAMQLPAVREAARADVPPVLREHVAELSAITQEMLDAAERMRVVAHDVKTFARHGEQDEEALVEVVSVLDATLKLATVLVRHRGEVRRRFDAAPVVRGSQARLAQVFLNLIVNAAQALPHGRSAKNYVEARCRLGPNGEAVIEIADNGVGIPAEVREKLFTPFFTTKPAGEGTGLGLSITRSIVEGYGGRIELESRVGEGTVFRVVLPAVPEVPARTPVETYSPPARRGNILIVDDEPSIGSSLQRLLSDEHEVVSLVDPAHALDRVRSNERFDAIICDLVMPGVSGYALFEEIGKISPELARRMIFITGGVFTAEDRAFANKVADRILEKPLDQRKLRNWLRELVA